MSKRTIDTTDGNIRFKDNTILSNTWQTLEESAGGLKRFSVKSRQNIALWFKANRNSSDVIQLRVRCFLDATSTDAYDTHIQTVGPSDIDFRPEILEFSEATTNAVIPLGISELVPYVELQAKVVTAGATPAEITEAHVSFEGVK